MFSRHGNRAPNAVVSSLCPARAAAFDASYAAQGLAAGAMTSLGVQSLWDLGRFTHSQYMTPPSSFYPVTTPAANSTTPPSRAPSFPIPDRYNKGFVAVRASASERTLLSAVAWGQTAFPASPVGAPAGSLPLPVAPGSTPASLDDVIESRKASCAPRVAADVAAFDASVGPALLSAPAVSAAVAALEAACGAPFVSAPPPGVEDHPLGTDDEPWAPLQAVKDVADALTGDYLEGFMGPGTEFLSSSAAKTSTNAHASAHSSPSASANADAPSTVAAAVTDASGSSYATAWKSGSPPPVPTSARAAFLSLAELSLRLRLFAGDGRAAYMAGDAPRKLVKALDRRVAWAEATAAAEDAAAAAAATAPTAAPTAAAAAAAVPPSVAAAATALVPPLPERVPRRLLAWHCHRELLYALTALLGVRFDVPRPGLPAGAIHPGTGVFVELWRDQQAADAGRRAAAAAAAAPAGPGKADGGDDDEDDDEGARVWVQDPERRRRLRLVPSPSDSAYWIRLLVWVPCWDPAAPALPAPAGSLCLARARAVPGCGPGPELPASASADPAAAAASAPLCRYDRFKRLLERALTAEGDYRAQCPRPAPGLTAAVPAAAEEAKGKGKGEGEGQSELEKAAAKAVASAAEVAAAVGIALRPAAAAATDGVAKGESVEVQVEDESEETDEKGDAHKRFRRSLSKTHKGKAHEGKGRDKGSHHISHIEERESASATTAAAADASAAGGDVMGSHIEALLSLIEAEAAAEARVAWDETPEGRAHAEAHAQQAHPAAVAAAAAKAEAKRLRKEQAHGEHVHAAVAMAAETKGVTEAVSWVAAAAKLTGLRKN